MFVAMSEIPNDSMIFFIGLNTFTGYTINNHFFLLTGKKKNKVCKCFKIKTMLKTAMH